METIACASGRRREQRLVLLCTVTSRSSKLPTCYGWENPRNSKAETRVKNADPRTGPQSGGSSNRNELIVKGHASRYILILPSLITEVQIVEVYVVGLLLVIAILLIVKGNAVPARSGPMAEGPVKGIGHSVESNGLI